MATESLRELAKNLKGQIAKIHSEVCDVSLEIEGLLKSKTEARERYDSCLNAGDQVGMSVCLTTIKKADEKIEVLKQRYKIFDQELEPLYEKQNEMKVVEQRAIKNCAEALKKAQEMKKSIDEEQNVCLGTLTQLSELQKSIDEKSRSFGKI